MNTRKVIIALVIVLLLGTGGRWIVNNTNLNFQHKVGDRIDSLNNVVVYFNGGVNNVLERNTSPDGYNIGLKYQCVEFVKRYYLEHFNHRMPDSYGHAKDFFNNHLEDGEKNASRDLVQYTNPSIAKPKVGDLVVFRETFFNRYGHVAIISEVGEREIEIIQQNPGPFEEARERFVLSFNRGMWEINNNRILGWLRKG